MLVGSKGSCFWVLKLKVQVFVYIDLDLGHAIDLW